MAQAYLPVQDIKDGTVTIAVLEGHYGSVTLRGFVSVDFQHLAAAFAADMTGWLKDGQIACQETILDGIERTAEGLIGLFTGVNRGKMLIRFAD